MTPKYKYLYINLFFNFAKNSKSVLKELKCSVYVFNLAIFCQIQYIQHTIP